jgi:hypothetical protein
MIVTHIDADHIDGSLILLQEFEELKVSFKELWFNGWAQIAEADKTPDSYAPLQGEFLDSLIKVNPHLKDILNTNFNHKAVCIDDQGPLRVVELAGSAKITLLGPTWPDLRRLRARWKAAIRDFSPGDTQEALSRLAQRREYLPPPTPASFAAPQLGDDRSPANGASIACIFEYDGAQALLAGDAHARTLAESLERLANQRSETRLHFDAVKLPHHGSMSNVSEDWLRWVDCKRWLISTNGAVFSHPDLETIQKVTATCPGALFLCNYKNIFTRLDQKGRGPWEATFPKDETEGPSGGLLISMSSSTE